MFELAELGEIVDLSTFNDIVKAFSDVHKSPSSNEATGKAVGTLSRVRRLHDPDVVFRQVLAAQTRLATAAGARPDFHHAFVVELLSLFVDTGISDNFKGLSKAEASWKPPATFNNSSDPRSLLQRSQTLLSLIPVLDAFFTSAKLDPKRKFDATEVGLFRNMWYLCGLAGFLSTPARVADWQRAALVRIAVQSPCLLADARHDFVETELEFDSILRRASHVIVRSFSCRALLYSISNWESNVHSRQMPFARNSPISCPNKQDPFAPSPCLRPSSSRRP